MPFYRLGYLDEFLADPAYDWTAIRATPKGRLSPLARLTRPRKGPAVRVRTRVARVADNPHRNGARRARTGTQSALGGVLPGHPQPFCHTPHVTPVTSDK
ncbi:hypothetical protein [Streptomyces sp. NPDC002057]|uniref:hypothetical protein n=1 Tax=Streptomyces sp. NPDC002057 TaxID=3154664 RepID=UPI003325659A